MFVQKQLVYGTVGLVSLSYPMLNMNNIWRLNKWTRHLFCFQDLKLVGISQPKYAAELAENRGKNRYNNVLPCKLFYPQHLLCFPSVAITSLTVEGRESVILSNHFHNHSLVTYFHNHPLFTYYVLSTIFRYIIFNLILTTALWSRY